MIKTTTETIDGTQFTTTQFPAMRGFEVFARLTRVLGPIFFAGGGDAGGAAASIPSADDVARLSPEAIGALGGAVAQLDPKDLSALLRDLLQNTQARVEVENEKDGTTQVKLVTLSSQEAIDRVLSGRVLTMLKVAAFAARVNFADFFDALAPSGAEAAAPTA